MASPLADILMRAEDAPYQQGDFQRRGPQMRSTSPLESIMNAFDVHKPWGVGDAVNAALWAIPGARGTIKPQPFRQPPQATNFNRSPEGMARDQMRAEINEGIERMRQQAQGQTTELGGKPVVLNPSDIQEAIRRRLANSEALASGAQPDAVITPETGTRIPRVPGAPPALEAPPLVAEYGQRLKQALGNKEAWESLFKELQADSRISPQDLAQISSEFHGRIPKGSSRTKALDNINLRQQKLMNFKDILD